MNLCFTERFLRSVALHTLATLQIWDMDVVVHMISAAQTKRLPIDTGRLQDGVSQPYNSRTSSAKQGRQAECTGLGDLDW